MSSDWLDQDSPCAATGSYAAGGPTSPTSTTMLTASFNQDGGCLAIGTTTGFELFNMVPFASSVRRTLTGSLGKIEMLFRCNLIALVGGPPPTSPYTPSHRVLIWDDHVQKAIGELSFRQTVLEVKLRRDAIAVALRDRVYVYHLADLSLRDKIYTTDNPQGLVAMSTAVQDMVLACPSVTDGHVRVELYGARKTVLLEAHESPLKCMALTEDGTQLATASIKGTVIRVFDVHTSTRIAEFRRGVERVQMTCLTWSWDHEHLACCSEKGTTHVFHVVPSTSSTSSSTRNASSITAHGTTSKTMTIQKKEKKSWYDKVRISLEGRDVRYSISQIRGVVHPTACAFVPDLQNTIAVVGWDVDGNGVVLLSDYSQEEAIRVAYHVICQKKPNSIPGNNHGNKGKEEEETEGSQRRKRMMGGTITIPSSNNTSGGGGTKGFTAADQDGSKLYVGERVEVLENIMKEIRFEEQDDGFLNVFGAGLDHTTTTYTATTNTRTGTLSADVVSSSSPKNENKEKVQEEKSQNDDDDDDGDDEQFLDTSTSGTDDAA